MLKKYIGKSRAENLDWLVNVWLKDGPPVCFLQGFSGVGKTDLARDVRELAEKQQTPDKKPKWQQAVMNEIADRTTPSVIESLMELSVTLSRQGLPDMERVLFEQKDPNLAFALEKALERPVVIILDEAERFFRDDTGAPMPEMERILNHLRYRQNLPGRLLLLSDRVVEELRWSEWIPKRTLTKLEPDEAVEALDTKLSETGLTVEIAPERKKEVVRDLDFNPRAIEALVAALRYETLDEIIGSNPGLWAVHDREVSRDFLKALERDLLERTMRHISEVHQRRLWRLAVHRRSFKREALEKLCGTKDEAAELRSILVTRYLLNFYKGALSLNPIVREISLGHLREESAEFKQAHSGAADYHLRHFKAKQIVGSQSQLGESFAELRYHLVMAGRESELGVIGERFTDHLKQEIKSVSPVPTNPEELDERIGVLTALLGSAGAKGLEYHLARCLQSRAKAGDIQQAVIHAERALGHGAPEAAWYLLANLKRQAEGPDAAIAVVRRGIRELKNPDLTAPLYQLGAEILSGANKTDEAVALLKEGIEVIPPDKNLFSLYQSCADLLSKVGKIEGDDGAVALLKEGIEVIPPDKNLFSLYQSCADLLSKVGKIEGDDGAVALLKEGIEVIPPDKNLFSLYQSCADLLSKVGKIEGEDGAVALLKKGIEVIPPDKNLSSLYQSCADLLSKVGKTDEAVALLKEGIKVIPPDKGVYALHQTLAELFQQQNQYGLALETMTEAMGKIPAGLVVNAVTQKYAELLAIAGRIDEAVAALSSAIKLNPRGTTPLYQSCADILAKVGKTDEAVALLKEGIKVIPPDKSLFSLYQISADLLAKVGKTDEAVALLKEGIKVIPPDKNLFSLYQLLGEVHCRAGHVQDAIAALREGFLRVSSQFSGYKLAEAALYLCAASDTTQTFVEILSDTGARAIDPPLAAVGAVLQCQMRFDWQAAADAASTARKQFSRHFGLASLESFSRLATGDAEAAWQALTSFVNAKYGVGEPHGWLAVLIHLRRGDRAEASAALAVYLGRPVDESRELNEAFLLCLWDQQEISPESHRLSFYFPILPASLTGLSQPVRRVQFGKPVLPVQTAAAPVSVVAVPPVAHSDEPEVYVSYAWGDDTSPEGIKREEVVNQMCAAVGRTGRVVGRDKTVMKPGDSIDAFADKIAKAPRIVAVISEKSLHSKFCMVDEIYSAYQRCGFRRDEFRLKVIALVMDDAKPLLTEDIALVKHWKAVHEKDRTALLDVDSERKELERWAKVHKLGEMCERLLGMLDAIKDTIMPRGYENIVGGNFQEVIARLPPKRT